MSQLNPIAQILAGSQPVDDKLQPLIETLADALDLDARLVAHHARLLRRAELLPPANAEIEPLHCARLLVAILAASRPLDAPVVARVFETLPATTQTLAVEDFGILPAYGEAFVKMTRTFSGALAGLIAEAARGLTLLPMRIEVSRSLDDPRATLVLDLEPYWRLPGAEKSDAGRVCYSRSPAVPNAPQPLRVTATCPGSVLQRLGDLLAGRQKGARKPLRENVSKDVEQRRQEIRTTEAAP